MKKLSVVILVVVLLALTVVPALAAGGPPADRGTSSGNCTGSQTGLAIRNQSDQGYGYQPNFGIRTPYALSGTISAIDNAAKTITVTVSCGNHLVTSAIGSNVTFQTSDTTRFLLRSDDASVTPITFAELAIGDTVNSHGSLVDGTWTAIRVTSGALLTCLK